MNISSIVESVLKRHSGVEDPELQKDISSNLEFRLLVTIDLNEPFREARKKFIKHYFDDILTLSLGNISLAAKKARLHRRHLHRIINDLEIDPAVHRKELLKPQEYMKNSVQNIIEDTLSGLKQDQKIRTIYSNLDDISEVIAKHYDSTLSYDEALELFEKEYIEKSLKQNNYNIEKTASQLDMSQRTLYRKINKFNI